MPAPGQRLYLDEARPAERATWVVDNSDLDRPVLRHRRNEGNLRHRLWEPSSRA